LKKGMRLQSDPTIIYGIVGGQGALGRSITKADIDAKSPYNTYQINGLPPGPICNPGRSALEASLHPAKTADLYFVADGTGGHTFSETLKEHNSAVQKWRGVEKQAKAKQGSNDTSADTDPDAAPIPSGANAAPAKSGAKPTKPSKAAKAAPASSGTGTGDDSGSAPVQGVPAAAVSPASASDIPLPVRKPNNQ
jgi:UPF0755 protein